MQIKKIWNLIQKHRECKKRSSQELEKKPRMKKTEIKIVNQGRCSVSADAYYMVPYSTKLWKRKIWEMD